MNQKTKQWWEKTRRKGQSNFVLIRGGVYGFLAFGIVIPIVNFIYQFIVNNYTLSFLNREFQTKVIFGLILSFPFGCLLGLLNWEYNEWRYSRHK